MTTFDCMKTKLPQERIEFIVTYYGDISDKLKKCGTQCPYVVQDGNTLLSIEVFRSRVSRGQSFENFVKMMEPILLQQCEGHGPIVSHRWVFIERESS